jgi:release factor glutamine methyltransferase
MRLITLPGVFQPRSDSWFLARVLAQHIRPGASVLDLCTGSGVLAIAAGMAGASEVVAVDVSRRAAATAWFNGRLNGVRVAPRVGNLFDAVGDRRFDVIASNPPYVPSIEDKLPVTGPARHWEGGPRGRVILDEICRAVGDHLAPGGTFLAVHSNVNGIEESLRRLREAGLEADVAARWRSPLGPLMAERAEWLRREGMLDGAEEEIVVVRGVRN